MSSTLTRAVCLVAALAALAIPASAQQPGDNPGDQLALAILRRAGEIRAAKASKTPDAAVGTFNLNRDFEPIYIALGQQNLERALLAIEERRVDKQVGSVSGSTAGSTSLVSKGGTPAILAFAVENGALAQQTSGTTVTFRGTPVGIVKALAKGGYIDAHQANDPAVALLQRLSLAVSFDTSRGIAEGGTPTLTGDRSQISAASLRINFIDDRDPRAAVNDKRWNSVAAAATALDEEALRAAAALRRDAVVMAWVADTAALVDAAPPADVEKVLTDQFRALENLPVSATTRAAAATAGTQFQALLTSRSSLLRDLATSRGTQLVFDYTYEQPTTGPRLGNFKLVASVGQVVQLTGNASVTMYNGSLPGGVSDRLRDIQAAVALDVPMGNPETIGRYVLSFSGKVQHMPNDLVAGANTLFPGTKGNVGIGQIKLTIPVKGSAAKIPLSVTFTNRTELNPEKKVFARAHLGFTYDLDAVFARFKP